jgi:DNA topoisomerase-1
MPGLTAKVFRTYNASYTFQEELKKTPTDAPVTEKCLAYNRSNRQVAILCNHQRTVSKAHGTQMEKLDERILALKYDRYLVRQKLLEADPKVKKRMPEVAEEESDMDEETIERKKMDKEQLEAERLEKRYQKMCEKAETEGKPKPEKPEPVDSDSRDVSIDRLEKQYSTLTAKIQNMKAMRTDKVCYLLHTSSFFY